MARSDRSGWRVSHPDDILRRLARSGRTMLPVSSESSYRRPTGMSSRGRMVLLALISVSVLAALPFVWPRNSITVEGLVPKQFLRAADAAKLEVVVSVKPASSTTSARVQLDGLPVPTRVVGGKLRFTLGPMIDGIHRITVTSGGGLLLRGPASKQVVFSIDSAEPTLTKVAMSAATSIQAPVTVTGVTEAQATVSVNGVSAVADALGRFTVRFAYPPVGALRISARDLAGNEHITMRKSSLAKLLPELRSVHVSQVAWADEKRRTELLALAAAGRITAVELDIKDEQGHLGHTSGVPLVNQLGASLGLYDLKAVVSELHAARVLVVGRVVTFRDPLFVEAAQRTGHPEQVVQDASGQPVTGKAVGYTNFGNALVRNYNSAVALEAAVAGVDVLMFDYVSRPDGDLSTMRFSGLGADGLGSISAPTAVAQTVSFINDAVASLRTTPVRVGVAVPGFSIRSKDTPPGSTLLLSRAVDYLAPVIFPSTFVSGTFDVADPPAQPGTIAERAVQAFQEALVNSGVRLVPRLQDFSLVRNYGDKQVSAQISGVAKRCVGDFSLWNAKVKYHAEALPATAVIKQPCVISRSVA